MGARFRFGYQLSQKDESTHVTKWDPSWLTTQIEQVRDGAGERFGDLELNALVQVTHVTDDRAAVVRQICARVEGLTPEHADAIPYLLVGTVEEIVAKLFACRARWGINYFVVRELDTFAPVVAALR